MRTVETTTFIHILKAEIVLLNSADCYHTVLSHYEHFTDRKRKAVLKLSYWFTCSTAADGPHSFLLFADEKWGDIYLTKNAFN